MILQQCPQCEGPINPEHFAEEPTRLYHREYKITYTYCQHCGMGWESLWEKKGFDFAHDMTVEYSRQKDPVKLGQFIQRVKDRTAVAA